MILGLAGAELAKVFCGEGEGVGVEEEFDSAEGFAAQGEVEEDGGVFFWKLGRGLGGHSGWELGFSE